MARKKIPTIYKEIAALDKVSHNGKDYLKNAVIRDSVVLSEEEAALLNSNPYLTGCRYELIGKASKEELKGVDAIDVEYRQKLEAKAKELGIKFMPNLGDAKLLDRILVIDPEFTI